MLRGLTSDLKLAVRGLRKTPGFTAVVVLVMALGIGANTVIFSVVNTILLKRLPLTDPDRLVSLVSVTTRDRGDEMSFPDLLDVAGRTKTLQGIGAYAESQAYLTLATEPERFASAFVTPSLFPTLGVAPIVGRGFVAEEGHQGKQYTSVILSHRVWSERLGSDPSVVGRTYRMNGRMRTVVGVMPSGFRFPENSDFWIPLAFDPEDGRGVRYLGTVARLAPGVTLKQSQAEMATLATHIAREYPDEHRDWSMTVMDYRKHLSQGIEPAMAMLMLSVIFVLLIACANVANLMLARATSRVRELGVRVALGASRARVVRLLLCESVVISLMGAGLGVLLANWGLELCLSAIPIDLDYWMRFGIDGTSIAYAVVVSVVCAVLFGVAPALQAGSVPLSEVLKEGGAQAGFSRGHHRTRNVLVVAEVALAIVLLAGSGLMVRSFLSMMEVRSGIQPDGVLTGRVTLPVASYPTDSVRIDFFAELMPRLASLTGVTSAAAMSNPPLADDSWSVSITREGQTDEKPNEQPFAFFSAVTPGTFATLGIPLLQGRDFTPGDRKGATRVAIVNRSAAQRLWPKDEAVGQRFKWASDTAWTTVVGVVGDVRQIAQDDERWETIYIPHAQSGFQTLTLMLRTHGDPTALTPLVRRLLLARDPNLPFYDVRSMRAALAHAVWEPRLYAAMMGTFAMIALGIAAVGLYGVMAYSVAQRTREIGIRMALGAAHGAVLRMVITQGMRLTVIGLGIGLAAAFGLTQAMTSMLFGVDASDPPTYVGVVLILVGSALLACWLPATRAARVDPMVALRHE